jgi:FixJ family two-component response regulator
LQKIPVISIIDDDKSVRKAMGSSLLGYSAAIFATAEEYLRSDRADDSSCVITDIMMPGMSGVKLHDQMIAAGHRTPVIFMTAFPEENIRARAMAAGAFGFLRKPFDDDCLIECLDRALKSRGLKPA